MIKPIFDLIITPCILMLLFVFPTLDAHGQTTLDTGDVAFVCMQQYTTGADTFAIVLLTDIDQNTEIGFTDGCYKDANGYHRFTSNYNEWFFIWKAPTGGLKRGTIVKFYSSATGQSTFGTGGQASTGTVFEGRGLSFNGNGDQIFAFQGISSIDTSSLYRLTVTRYLAGIHLNILNGYTSDANWDGSSSAAGLLQSELPNTLLNGSTALWLDSNGVERLNAAMTSNVLSLDKTVINNAANWTSSNTPSIPAIPEIPTWNGTTWNGTPGSTTDVVINSSTTPGSFTARSLRINSGYALTLGGGVTATVYGDIFNDGDGISGSGTVLFNKSGTASLYTDTLETEGIIEVASGCTLTTNNFLTLKAVSSSSYGQLLPGSAGSISGNVHVEKVMDNVNAGWRNYFFPVASPTSITNTTLLFSGHSMATERNVFFWDATDAGSGIAVGWTSPSSFSGSADRGYTVYHNNTHTGLHDLGSQIAVSGTINFGTQTAISIPNTFDPDNSGNSSYQGWSLIGNPYPFNIDVAVLVASGGFGSGNKSIQVWNGTTVVGLNTGIIAPFQAFWVKADGSSQTIQFTNSVGTNSSATIYMKNGRDLFRLMVKDAENRYDQLTIHFDVNATDKYEGILDIPKFRSTRADVPTLYSKAGDVQVTQNAVAPTGTFALPVYFEAAQNGKVYTFSAIKDEYLLNLPVSLEDRKTGIFHDILQSEYSFVHDKQFSGDRFVLHFGNVTSGLVENSSLTQSKAWTSEGKLTVEVPEVFGNVTVQVIDLLGRVWYAGQLTQGKQELHISDDVKGILLVKIINGNQTSVHKVFR